MKKTIVHQISLTNIIGGVQSSFIYYYKEAIKSSQFDHEVFGMHPIDMHSKMYVPKYKNIRSSIFVFFQFCFRLCSKNYIIHFYNNLGSRKLYYLLKILPVNNIILHERGASWNLPSNKSYLIQSNIKNASKVIVNSLASKILLKEKFNIKDHEIAVIYNGIFTHKIDELERKTNNEINIGFLGRLDTHKGVHTFIDLSKKINNYNFLIAGSGALELILKEYGKNTPNLKFLGRVNPLDFLLKTDILIVPSIREPLGNIIIEAGFLKCPVIASNIDGIPEIISNNESGILLSPKTTLRKIDLPPNAVPYPEFVIDGETRKLVTPKELDLDELQIAVESLISDRLKRKNLSEKLFLKVNSNFSLPLYFQKLEILYKSF